MPARFDSGPHGWQADHVTHCPHGVTDIIEAMAAGIRLSASVPEL